MSRFNNLEIGKRSEEKSGHGSALKGESWYLEEAMNHYQRAHFEAALRSFGRMLEFNRKSAAAWAGQVRILIEMGDYAEASQLADKGLEVVPDAAELLAAKAVALGRLGDTRGAMVFSDSAVEAGVPTPYVWLSRGDVLLARNEKKPDYCFEKALSLAGADWFVHWLAARIQTFYKRFSIALQVLQKALAINGGEAVIWLEQGKCQLALGMVGLAEHSLKQAETLAPDCPGIAAEVTRLKETGIGTRLGALWRMLFRK